MYFISAISIETRTILCVQKKSSNACFRIGLRVDLYEIGSGFHRFPQQTLVQELLICPDWKILLFRFSNETAIPELKSTFSAGWR